KLYADPAWRAFQPKIRPLILRQENKTLIPAPWSPNP
ncbi:MAG: NIPSNAP family protein, partial [Alphaproteobacteria bacterium]